MDDPEEYNDPEIYKEVQERIERQYKRHLNYKRWLKLSLIIFIPVWVVAGPVVWAGTLDNDLLGDPIFLWLIVAMLVSGGWFVLHGIDVFVILDQVENKRAEEKWRQFNRELERFMYAEMKVKRGTARLGDDGEIVDETDEEKPKRKRSAQHGNNR